MSGDERVDSLEAQVGRLELEAGEHPFDPEQQRQESAPGQHRDQQARGYRRRGRGGHRGRGRGGHRGHDGEQPPAEHQAPAERGAKGHRRFYRGGGGAAHRTRTKSERSSLLDGMREPLPQNDMAMFDGVEDFWDVVVSGYGPEMTEDDLWDVFGQQDVAEIIQFFTHDLKPYCHIYTTSQRMTQELLKCDRDVFRGHQLHVALSEDLIGRSISQTLRKQAAKAARRPPPRAADDAEQQQQQPAASESPPAAAAAAPDVEDD